MVLVPVLIVIIFILLTALYFQNLFLQVRYKREIASLKESMRKLKRECDEANVRAGKYEDDFQKELTRISVLLSRVT